MMQLKFDANQEFQLQAIEAVAGLLVHSGGEIKRLDEKILAIPWTMLTG